MNEQINLLTLLASAMARPTNALWLLLSAELPLWPPENSFRACMAAAEPILRSSASSLSSSS